MRQGRLKRWCVTGAFGFLTLPVVAAEPPTGQISGSVRLEGRPPRIAWIDVEHDQEVCGGQARPAQTLVLGATQTVRDVIIYLGAPPQLAPATPAPVVVDQQRCELVPRVQVARCGATLILQNSDPLLHVIRLDLLGATNAPAPLLQVAAPYAGFERRFALPDFRAPALLRAGGGNGHEWMTAYIAVLPHPWGTLTDAGGRFALRSVPPGQYKLYAWHEVLGTLARDVAVSANHTTVADLTYRRTE